MIKKLPLLFKLTAARLLSGLRRKVIGPRARAVLTQGFNGYILVSPDDLFIGRRLAWLGEYNRPQVERLMKLAEGRRVLIVGTHVGTILVPVARVAQSVVGIEADPNNFELARWNVLLNGLKNAVVRHLAASDRSGRLKLLTGRVNTGGSKVDQGVEHASEFFYDSPGTIEVDALRLDKALEGERFDLILMDIEGSEYRALKGMPEILFNAETLVLEILPNHVDNIAKVTAEDFLLAIPPKFVAAYYMHGEHSEVFVRNRFADLAAQIWREHYFDGCDVAFTSGGVASERPSDVAGTRPSYVAD